MKKIAIMLALMTGVLFTAPAQAQVTVCVGGICGSGGGWGWGTPGWNQGWNRGPNWNQGWNRWNPGWGWGAPGWNQGWNQGWNRSWNRGPNWNRSWNHSRNWHRR